MTHPREHGTSILEAVIAIPVLLILFSILIDGFFSIQTYTTLSDVAHEASRYGATIVALEPGTYCTGCQTSEGVTTPPAPPNGHRELHDRVTMLLQAKSWYARVSEVSILTQLQDDTGTGITGDLGPNDPAKKGLLQIRLSGKYTGMFGVFTLRLINMRVTVAGPYLN